MHYLAALTGSVLILIALWDAFETIVLPRRVTRRVRLARLFYRFTWPVWVRSVRLFFPLKTRENVLSYYGPLSFILLLILWALFLISGFALLYWAIPSAVRTPEYIPGFAACLYFSGTTFFTLGLGDITPSSGWPRLFAVIEAGMGFAFLAMIISYLPSLQQSFARREVNISLLDARAGSPPTAYEILWRHSDQKGLELLTRLLAEWERWSAEMLESHLSFPMLAYFRSQHDNQSWLAALTAILDTCAFAITHFKGECVRQARLTFAMARHTLVDLALVLYAPPRPPDVDRLPVDKLIEFRGGLHAAGIPLHDDAASNQHLREMRDEYDAYLTSLSRRLLLPLPPWMLKTKGRDNWEVSAWGPNPPAKEHF